MVSNPRWKDLSIGLVGLACVVAVALLILIYGRLGRLGGNTVTVYATTNQATGVLKGTEVWLDGQRIGLVEDIHFQPPSVEPSERLVLSLDILDNARPNLRLDSRLDVRSGTSILGDQVVYLSSSGARQRAVTAGDTIHGGEQVDGLAELTTGMSLASRELLPIMANVKLLAAQLRTAQGTLGAFGMDVQAPGTSEARLRGACLLSRLFSGQGTLGRALAHGESNDLRTRYAEVMAQVDSIRLLLGSNDHSLGRLRRDSTLAIELKRMRDELAEVQRLASTPTGTIGRLRTDSVLVRNIHRDMAALDSLFADIKARPFRYIIF